jgi:hypothetical protein
MVVVKNSREDNLAWSSCNTHVAPPVCCAVDTSPASWAAGRVEEFINLFDAVFGRSRKKPAIRPGSLASLAVDGASCPAPEQFAVRPAGRTGDFRPEMFHSLTAQIDAWKKSPADEFFQKNTWQCM